MRVFVTGATGVIGRRLVERFADRGHEVYGLVRDDSGAELVETRGGTPRRGDVLDRPSLAAGIPGDANDGDESADVDAIVHAATSIPTATRPTGADWQRNDRVRLEGARNLVAVAGEAVDRVLFPSVVWVARQPDGSAFDEDAPRRPDRTTQSAAATEQFLQEAGDEHGFEVTILRLGFLYAPDAAHTRRFGESLLERRMPIVGRGLLGRRDAALSFLHADDAARAFAVAIDGDQSGSYHVVDDRPVTLASFLSTFADRLDAPAPRRVPAWLARALVGADTVRLLSSPMPTSNDRFRSAFDWAPTYPSYGDGLDQVIDTWRDDGTLAETQAGYRWQG